MVNFRRILVAAVLAAAPVATSAAQPPSPAAPPSQGTPAAPPSQGPVRTLPTVCGLAIPEPSRMPPANSGPVVFQVVPCFQKQGGFSVIDAQTYLYYIEMTRNVSSPSNNRWVPYDDKIETVVLGDFKRLWATNFLDDLAVDIQDYKFANGVVGKMIVYDMEERQRVKIVDYIGSKQIEQSKIDEELKKQNMRIALDSFIDQGLIRRVAGVVRDLYAEKGYEYAEVKPEIKPVTSGTKTVNLTFHITEGPKVKIREVEFLGNAAIGDSKLASKMKENKGPNRWAPFILRGGTFKEGKFEEDADLVVQYYRERGYVRAQVGQPQLRILEDSKDGRTRFVELQVPVTEGPRYKVGAVNFSGNSVVKSEGLRPLFKLGDGDWFNEKHIRKGFEKAREVYGSIGYFEFTGAPDYSFRDMGNNGKDPAGAAAGPPPPSPSPSAEPASPPSPPAAASAGPPAAGPTGANGKSNNGEPIVDITMRLDEGKQYYVNRLIFLGNTTTRDNVIRREVRLLENGVFNTEALKYSVRRLNQLGYFKPLEGEAIDVQKTPNADPNLPPTVDVRLKFEEQNRNQITFGAGVSQYEGFFGQLAFQTSNFLGRGETFSVSAQQGNRAKNYQVGFTEPFLFDRPITAGIDLFNNEIQYIGQFTQASRGMNTVWGFPAGAFSRFFVSYSYQAVRVKDLNPFYSQAANLANNPFLADSLLLNQNGERRISKIGPSFLFNTIDNPIFPTTGRKLSLGFELAGLGGNTKFYSTKSEGILYKALNRRTSIGMRAAFEYISPYGEGVAGLPPQLPIFEKLFLGGEYSIRGFDIRSVGPRDLNTGIVIGGNKSLLFNAEYLINIAGPVRLVLFADAGQVRNDGEGFKWRENVVRRSQVGALLPADALTQLYAASGFIPSYRTTDDVVGTTPAFKSSTGAEIRFFMPVLNVPFRLIFAMNPSRGNVLDNNLQPEKKFKFRFAVGTTF